MAPRVKITREEIVEAAIGLVRQRGEAALNARNIAASLNCSTQPVFSQFFFHGGAADGGDWSC